ncbi:MAG: HEAT repeat domain-containing protein [Gemmatimonadales bacterium]
MHQADWDNLIRDLRQVDNLDLMVAAAAQLRQTATKEDVPRLQELLSDEDFFVREAAAWPLSEIAGVSTLPELLRAYQRGLDEGHDNDGLSAALTDLAITDAVNVSRILETLARSGDPAMEENAKWLLTFCTPSQDV